MNIRQLVYLTTLARERHFGRAAALCNVTQPTLSLALKQLEDSLGVALVDRGNQGFRGFTAEGAQVLDWARRVLADYEALTQQLAGQDQDLTGQLRLGVIPAAMPMIAEITQLFWSRAPQVSMTILSRSSQEIQRGIDDFHLEAGISYLDNEPLDHVRTLPLYVERFFLLAPVKLVPRGRSHFTWAQAATLPLCLLTPDMQNRRILNRAFHNVGVDPHPLVETNSLFALYAHVRAGLCASILPHSLFQLLTGWQDDSVALPMIEPEISQTVGLIYPDREPIPRLTKTLIDCLTSSDITKMLAARARTGPQQAEPNQRRPIRH